MKDASDANFGLVIAYVIPGFVVLWGAGSFVSEIESWIGNTSVTSTSVGGFLYLLLAAIGAGLTASTVRWLIVDTLHHTTGIERPQFDFSRLGERVEAFELLLESHYRYYQFYSNTLVAVIFAFAARRITKGFTPHDLGPEAGCFALAVIFFIGSRDSLKKYYERIDSLLSQPRSSGAWADEE